MVATSPSLTVRPKRFTSSDISSAMMVCVSSPELCSAVTDLSSPPLSFESCES
jgi:hypothetical protein